MSQRDVGARTISIFARTTSRTPPEENHGQNTETQRAAPEDARQRPRAQYRHARTHHLATRTISAPT